MEKEKSRFGFILRQLRNEKNLAQDKFALEIGYSKAIISEWENGKKTPNGNALIELSKFFGKSTDYLLGLEDEFGNDYTKDLPPIHLINKETKKVKNRITIELSDEQLKKLLTQIDNSDSNELTFEYKNNNTHLIHKEKKSKG